MTFNFTLTTDTEDKRPAFDFSFENVTVHEFNRLADQLIAKVPDEITMKAATVIHDALNSALNASASATSGKDHKHPDFKMYKNDEYKEVKDPDSSEDEQENSEPESDEETEDGQDDEEDHLSTELYESEDQMVSHPPHYQGAKGLEVIDVISRIVKNYDGMLAYDIGNIVKYAIRWPKKGGKQDLEKIIWYASHARSIPEVDKLVRIDADPYENYYSDFYNNFNDNYPDRESAFTTIIILDALANLKFGINVESVMNSIIYAVNALIIIQ